MKKLTLLAVIVALAIVPSALAKGGKLHLNFKYLGTSKWFSTNIDGVPLKCREYYGPGHVIITCVVPKHDIVSPPKS